MAAPTKYDRLLEVVKGLRQAERDSVRAAEARASLPQGSSRARVTTANARWMTTAESRDGWIQDVAEEVARLPSLCQLASDMARDKKHEE